MRGAGFGGTRQKYLGPQGLAGLLLTLALAGCAAQAPVEGMMPYAFAPGIFLDVRSEEAKTDAEIEPHPVDVVALQQAVIGELPATMWGARPALLDMELQHFETSALGPDRALSVAVRLRAREPNLRGLHNGYELGSVDATCSVVGHGDGANPEQAIKAVRKNGLDTLLPAARDARQWDALTTQCAADLARQLRNRLLQPPKPAN